MADALVAAGYRVITPTLRGFGGTRFLSDDTPRSGQLSALGRDMVDFIAALGLDRPVLVGHDWGARSVANACGLPSVRKAPSFRTGMDSTTAQAVWSLGRATPIE